MTRKEHLLKLIPNIEYDLPLEKLNLILDAMENHTEEQLQLGAVSGSLLCEFGVWNTIDNILVSKYDTKEKAKKICDINSRISGKLHKVVMVVVLDCH